MCARKIMVGEAGLVLVATARTQRWLEMTAMLHSLSCW